MSGIGAVHRHDHPLVTADLDFFGAGHALNQIDGGRARKLLEAFSAGRWHRRVQVSDAPV